MTTLAKAGNAQSELEAPVTLAAMLLCVGFAAFVMLQWGGLASAFARSIDDTGNATATSLAAVELE